MGAGPNQRMGAGANRCVAMQGPGFGGVSPRALTGTVGADLRVGAALRVGAGACLFPALRGLPGPARTPGRAPMVPVLPGLPGPARTPRSCPDSPVLPDFPALPGLQGRGAVPSRSLQRPVGPSGSRG
jgi:hypothetical protein